MKKYITLIILIAFCIAGYAQDARIAHPFLWRTYYNPAYCGAERLLKVDVGAQTTYTHRPTTFVDSHIAAEFPWATNNVTWCAGLKVSDQYQGSGLLNIASVSPMLSIGMILANGRHTHSILQVGAEFDIYSTKTNFNKMVFADQLDPYYGQYKDFSEELSFIPNESLWTFDMAVGIYGETYFRRNSGAITLKYGISLFHALSNSTRSFYSNNESDIYMPSFYNKRLCAHFDYVHPYDAGWSSPVYFAGYGIYELQANMHDIQFGFYSSIKYFMVGLSCKVERYDPNYTLSNLIFHAVFSKWVSRDLNFKIAYSFEFPLTQGFVTETSIHSLSLHFCYDYKTGNSNFKCGRYSKPSDAAWYEYTRAIR